MDKQLVRWEIETERGQPVRIVSESGVVLSDPNLDIMDALHIIELHNKNLMCVDKHPFVWL
jgi:hypothetical protein